MPQAWQANNPNYPTTIKIIEVETAKPENFNDDLVRKDSKKLRRKKENCCRKCLKNLSIKKCPLWSLLLIAFLVSAILLIAFGLAFGLTYYFVHKKNDITTTTIGPRVCKNFGILDAEKDKCECREYTSGEFCEILTSCDELPPDDPECDSLAEILEEIDKETFAAFCPRHARCSSSKSIQIHKFKKTLMAAGILKSCKNFGIFDYKRSKCICSPYVYGEECEKAIDCKFIKDDPFECKILQNMFNDSLINFVFKCPKTFFCKKTTLLQ